MTIGVDFDNTLVCYDRLFHRAALERGLIRSEVPPTKVDVRNYLRRIGNEPAFTELQGWIYGPGIVEAEMFSGADEFFRRCRQRGLTVKIISHKTRFPYAGERHDLHAAAMHWLERQGFFASDGIALPRSAVFFELTKEGKLARIAAEKCDVFIDDLPELLSDAKFPTQTRRVLFDPAGTSAEAPSILAVRSWEEIDRAILVPVRVDGGSIFSAANALFQGIERRLTGQPERLPGGGNNRVFAAEDEWGTKYLLKQYFLDASGGRDRFESERRFYRLATQVAAGFIPKAFAWDATGRLALLEYVQGRKLSAGVVGADAVDAALSFFRALNADRENSEAMALPVAAEACFTPEEHCQAVDRRIARLTAMTPTVAIDRDARSFVQAEVVPVWKEVKAAVLRSDAESTSAPLPSCERCISPSDFGFHNSLVKKEGTLVFLDFEYAGWDDPAKMVCDFFCQPAVPVPMGEFERFSNGVARALGASSDRFAARCHLLLPLYRVKWCGIMLNEFVLADLGRRAFALGEGAVVERKEEQLAKARFALETLRASAQR